MHSHGPGAVLRGVHPAPIGDEFQHLLVAATGVRHVAQREDLPQQHAEGPTPSQTG